MKQLLSVGLLAGLMALVAARPWSGINSALGITTVKDSLRADSAYHDANDTLLIDSVAVRLPRTGSDSLPGEVDSLIKSNAERKLQAARLKKENLVLDAQIGKRQRALEQKQQTLLSLGDMDQLLQKQNGKGSQTAASLDVTELEQELNQRAQGPSKRRAKRLAEKTDP